jgi:ACS family hexuronate transporter-like MFS transporter
VLTARFGWQSAFLFTGSLSMMWAVIWFLFYREPERHPWLSPAELQLIRSGQDAGVATQRFSCRTLRDICG